DGADYNGMGKGIADIVITDMAANTKVRLVDRSHIQSILEEQNLAKSGAVDPETAVRLGKLLGVCYAITGGFMSDGKGSVVFTARTVSIETGRVGNPEKVQAKSDDILGMLAQLSAKLNGDLDLSGC